MSSSTMIHLVNFDIGCLAEPGTHDFNYASSKLPLVILLSPLLPLLDLEMCMESCLALTWMLESELLYSGLHSICS